MGEGKQTVFIIDTYSKYTNDKIISVFRLYGKWYCIKEVELYFGKPILSSVEEMEDEFLKFEIYETEEEARAFARKLKQLEGMKWE